MWIYDLRMSIYDIFDVGILISDFGFQISDLKKPLLKQISALQKPTINRT